MTVTAEWTVHLSKSSVSMLEMCPRRYRLDWMDRRGKDPAARISAALAGGEPPATTGSYCLYRTHRRYSPALATGSSAVPL